MTGSQDQIKLEAVDRFPVPVPLETGNRGTGTAPVPGTGGNWWELVGTAVQKARSGRSENLHINVKVDDRCSEEEVA